MKTLNLLALLLLCTSASAQPDQAKRRGPPPEALEACKGKAAGTAVEMKTPRGELVKGVCRMVLIPLDDGPGRKH
ncbi:MAG: hypothetical protein V4484_02295 [Pseudomonadota bacterium]